MKNTLTLIAVFFCLAFKHPIYMGVCDLKYNQASKVMEGTVRVFNADIEDALSKQEGKRVDLINPPDKAELSKLLERYLKKRLSFELNYKPLKYDFLGWEIEGESVWIYIEMENCPPPKHVKVINSVLYDHLKEQINIVHVEVGSKKQSSRLNNPNKVLVFDF